MGFEELNAKIELKITIRRIEERINNLKSPSPKKISYALYEEGLDKVLTELDETKARLKANIKKNEEVTQTLYLIGFSLMSFGLGIFVGVYWF